MFTATNPKTIAIAVPIISVTMRRLEKRGALSEVFFGGCILFFARESLSPKALHFEMTEQERRDAKIEKESDHVGERHDKHR